MVTSKQYRLPSKLIWLGVNYLIIQQNVLTGVNISRFLMKSRSISKSYDLWTDENPHRLMEYYSILSDISLWCLIYFLTHNISNIIRKYPTNRNEAPPQISPRSHISLRGNEELPEALARQILLDTCSQYIGYIRVIVESKNKMTALGVGLTRNGLMTSQKRLRWVKKLFLLI